jgi:argininosuccinate synthase
MWILFTHGGVTASAEFNQERRLAATRAAGDHHKAVDIHIPSFGRLLIARAVVSAAQATGAKASGKGSAKSHAE